MMNERKQIGFLCYDLQPFTEDCLYRISQVIDSVKIKAYPVFFHPNQEDCRVPYRPSKLKGKPLEVNVKGNTPEGFASNVNWKCAWDCVHQSDIVILYGLQGATALSAGLFGMLLRKTLISANRTLPVVWERKRRWWVRLLKKWLLNRCDYHIYQTLAAKDVLTSVYKISEDRLFYAPFEAGAGWFGKIMESRNGSRQTKRTQLGISDEVVFLFSGNLTVFKGVKDLIKATALLPKDGGYVCIFAGPEVGNNNKGIEYFRAITRQLGVERHIKFTGQLNAEELADMYLASDVVVLPTHKDCTPKVIVEAALASKPIITTNAHGWPGTLINDGENGYIIEPGDIKALTRAMEKMFDGPLREKMGNRSRELVTQCCDSRAETQGFIKAINAAVESMYPVGKSASYEL